MKSDVFSVTKLREIWVQIYGHMTFHNIARLSSLYHYARIMLMRVRLLSIGNYRIDICFACCVWNSRTRGSCAAKFTVIAFHYWRCKKWLLCRHEGLVDKLLRIVRAILSQLRERFIQLLKEGWNWKKNLLTNWTGHTASFLVKFSEYSSPSICERCKRIFFISES